MSKKFERAGEFHATLPNALAPCVVGDTTYSNFTVDVLENKENGVPQPVSAFIQPRVEMFYGAHYYAHSAMSTTYPSAEITVDLTKTDFIPDSQKRRIGCISLSCSGYNGGACDMGIENKGDGWFAHYWSYNNNAEGSKSPHPGAKSVTITVETIIYSNDDDALEGEYVWTEEDGTKTTEHLLLIVRKGQLFTRINNQPYVRWTRFMSLIHNGAPTDPSKDPKDNSYLKGVITSPKLITAPLVKVSWGRNLLDHVWGTQAKNIKTLVVEGKGDTFECRHSTYVY